jgi:hypothetical protein
MSLEKIVDKTKSIIKSVSDYFIVPESKNAMREYALKHYLTDSQKKTLFENKSELEKKQIYETLDSKINERSNYHKKHLDTAYHKIGKFAGLGALITDINSIYRGTPLDNFILYRTALVGSKALLELPAMYSYLKDSKDFYGAIEWLGTKAISACVPFLGPIADHNVVKRIIKKKIVNEGVESFLKQYGLYEKKEPLYKRIYNRVKKIAGPITPQISYQAT